MIMHVSFFFPQSFQETLKTLLSTEYIEYHSVTKETEPPPVDQSMRVMMNVKQSDISHRLPYNVSIRQLKSKKRVKHCLDLRLTLLLTVTFSICLYLLLHPAPSVFL